MRFAAARGEHPGGRVRAPDRDRRRARLIMRANLTVFRKEFPREFAGSADPHLGIDPGATVGSAAVRSRSVVEHRKGATENDRP